MSTWCTCEKCGEEYDLIDAAGCQNCKFEELKKLAAPIVAYLRKNYNPHCGIIIDCDRVTLTESIMGVIMDGETPTQP